MEMNENKRKDLLLSLLNMYIATSISVLKYLKATTSDEKARKVCDKSIRQCRKAQERLHKIKHIEILQYFYDTFIGNNVIAYSVSGSLVNSKKVALWDTDKHFQEFLDEMEEQRIYRERKEQERIDSINAIKKAKEQGKKVEMVYDKDKKKVIPVIIDDKDN